jgi:hypothetical protein
MKTSILVNNATAFARLWHVCWHESNVEISPPDGTATAAPPSLSRRYHLPPR